MQHDATVPGHPGEEPESHTPADAALLRMVDGALTSDALAGHSAGGVNVEAALAKVRARIAAEESGAASSVPGGVLAETSRPALTVARGGATGSASISAAGSTSVRSTQPRVARQWFRSGAGLAAAAVLCAAVGLGVWRMAPGDTAGTSQASVYTTRVGVRDSVLLSDGSRVVLAPGSRLTVASGFAASRVVELEGAAYFDVQHDAAHPFTVRSNGAEIRDIGTAFSVNTDAAGAVVVAVTEGIVAMQGVAGEGSAPVELRAGDRGTLKPGTGTASEVAVQRGRVTPSDVAWTRGEITYRDTPLREVQADLRRWYGIELQAPDSVLATRTLTASLRPDAADQALQIIAIALGAEMSRTGDTVVLRAADRTRQP